MGFILTVHSLPDPISSRQIWYHGGEPLSHGSNFYFDSDESGEYCEYSAGLSKEQEGFLTKILKKELWENYLVKKYPFKGVTNVVRFYKFDIAG